MVPNAPPAPVFSLNPVVKLAVTNTQGSIALKLHLSAEPVRYTIVLGAAPQGAGVSYVDHYSILGLLPEPVAGVSDIT